MLINILIICSIISPNIKVWLVYNFFLSPFPPIFCRSSGISSVLQELSEMVTNSSLLYPIAGNHQLGSWDWLQYKVLGHHWGLFLIIMFALWEGLTIRISTSWWIISWNMNGWGSSMGKYIKKQFFTLHLGSWLISVSYADILIPLLKNIKIQNVGHQVNFRYLQLRLIDIN